jgi:hypothetical protein
MCRTQHLLPQLQVVVRPMKSKCARRACRSYLETRLSGSLNTTDSYNSSRRRKQTYLRRRCWLWQSAAHCWRRWDEEISALARGCPALGRLQIIGTSVTLEGLRAIREHCKTLKEIELNADMFPGEDYEFFPPDVEVGINAT